MRNPQHQCWAHAKRLSSLASQMFAALACTIASADDLAGHKLLLTSVRTGNTELFVVDPVWGDAQNVSRSPTSEERYACWSPNGNLIAYTGHIDGGVTVFLMNVDRSDKRVVVNEVNPFGAVFPNWSPDSGQIVFSKNVGKGLELFLVDPDGSKLRQLTDFGDGAVCTPAAWPPDGEWLSLRFTDERYWSNPERMEKVYGERPADKRPVSVVRPDGSDAHVIECLKFQCAMDGSRAAWKTRESGQQDRGHAYRQR